MLLVKATTSEMTLEPYKQVANCCQELLLLLNVCVDKMIPNAHHVLPSFPDFVQLTKDGVCPKESKQKEREPSRGPKYARRRQKFYIYS